MNKIENAQLEGVWGQLLDSSNLKNGSLQQALRTNLAKAILDGRIPEATRLPSTRLLASALNIARITVALAYEALATQGLLVPRQRRGHFVAQGVRHKHDVRGDQILHPFSPPIWSAYLGPPPRGQQWLGALQSPHEISYSFINETIDDTILPIEDWQECTREAQTRAANEPHTTDVDDPSLSFSELPLWGQTHPIRSLTFRHFHKRRTFARSTRFPAIYPCHPFQ